jgi:asparagine synthase (glutamine-hydrolysing)
MLYLLYRACHQAGFKVILTGEGSDDLLAGYPWYQGDQRVRPFLGLPAAGRKWVWRLASPLLRGSRRALLQGTPDPVQRFTIWLESDRPRGAERLFNMAPQPSVTQAWQEQYSADLQGLHPLHQFQAIEQGTRLVDYINLNMDALSMAHSVEARPPFLDHLLWEFTARLPPGTKLNWRENKRLLRLGMDGRLPEAVRRRPKLGLTAPEVTWWRSERMPEWAEELLTPQALAQSGYFKPGEVQHLRQMHQGGHINASRTLTGILTTQIWHFELIQA